MSRWRVEGACALDRVCRETGGAVPLCSLTTVIGYGSLLAADERSGLRIDPTRLTTFLSLPHLGVDRD